MESSGTHTQIFNAQAVTAGQVLRSSPIIIDGRNSLSGVIRGLGDIAATITVEVSNATKEQVQDGVDDWTADDTVDIDALAPANRVMDTDDLEFRRYTDASPDLTADYATTAALPACTASGSGVGKTLTANAVGILTADGVAVVLNKVILVKDEANRANNGQYKCTTAGTAGVAFILTRSTTLDATAEATTGKTINVTAGDTQSGVWTLMAPPVAFAYTPYFRLARLLVVATAAGTIDAGCYVRGV